MYWDTLQAKVNGLKLNNLLKEEVMDLMEEKFEDKRVDVVNIQFTIRDKKINDLSDYHVDLVTLTTANFENLMLGNVIVDVDNEDNFDKIKEVIYNVGDLNNDKHD